MRKLVIMLGLIAAGLSASAQEGKFVFGTNAVRPGATRVSVTNLYSSATGFGFEQITVLGAGRGFVDGEPFRFSVRVPEGNYLVTVGLGTDSGRSTNTIKAEARRLLVEQAVVPLRGTVERQFVVNVRQPEFAGTNRVRLKPRELETEMITWDDRLTLEFTGNRPAVRWLEVARTNVPTLFLAGDSTVCDQPAEPWNSWGQMLPRFFGPGLAVANFAQSGESIRSSLSARRFDKIFSLMGTNDWLLIQFGHNDMKDRATNALAVYRKNLANLVARTRARGGTPVLVTSMERKSGVRQDTLAGYPETVRAVARAEGVALIDLHALSRELYAALGANLDRAFQDGTHHNNYGSYLLAQCVVTGIQDQVPGLAPYLVAGVERFDPARPLSPDQFQLPPSLTVDVSKPEGN